ncbi:MAG: hypothetical protein ABFD59_05235 [Smithella sp.]
MSRLRHIVIPDYPTTVTADRFPVFTDPADAQIVLDVVLHGRSPGWWKVIAFVVMLDHLHIMMIHTALEPTPGHAAANALQ